MTTVRVATQSPIPGTEAADPFPQPPTWVAVEATMLTDGAVTGHFWRTSDGSTRLEYQAADARGITIEIRNIAERTYYVFRPAQGWVAHPMVLPTSGWRPAPVGRSGVGEKVASEAGLDVYERRRGDGTADRRVPHLNFLTVRETLPNGAVRTLEDLRMRQPAPHLFRPPQGAPVTRSSIPAGIVALPSPGVQE